MDAESEPATPSTKDSSLISLIDELWCILDPRVGCTIFCISGARFDCGLEFLLSQPRGAVSDCIGLPCLEHRE